MYRTLLGIAAALIAALLIVGLSFSSSRDERADFRFINGPEPPSLDPHLVMDQSSGRVVPELFEGLTRLRARDLQAVPGIAEHWEISEDQKRYRFFLRSGCVWSDGVPITARDLIYSWKRLLEPSLGAEYAYLLHMVRFAEAYNTFEGLAETLEGKVVTALAELERSQPVPLAAEAWQRFLAEQQVEQALKYATHPATASLLYDRTTPVTGEDLATFRRIASSTAQWLRSEATTARARFGVDAGIFAENDHTLVVELRAATPYFLEITSFYPTVVVPRHAIEKNPSNWFLPGNMVSNGAFRLESWRISDRLRMVRNERYWGKDEVHLSVVDAMHVENTTTALNLYLTGAADWLPEWYPKDLVPRLRTRPDFESSPGLVVYYYRLNTTRPPLNDKRVRKAFNLAIDRQLITEKVLGLGQLPAYTFVPPGLPGYEPPNTAIRYDVQAARALLAEAGFPEGRGFPKLGVLYNTNDMHKKLAEVVADQLRRNLGIEIVPYNQEWQAFLVTSRSKQYDMARAGWNGDYADANTFLDMWVTNGPNNQTGWSSSTYDALIRSAADIDLYLSNPAQLVGKLEDTERIRALSDRAQSAPLASDRVAAKHELRLVLMREAEAILVQDELPIIPVYFYVTSSLVSPRMRGFYAQLQLANGRTVPNLLDNHPLRDVRMVPDPGGD